MTSARLAAEDLGEIYELNRLFLTYLRDRVHGKRDCLDLAPATARLLGAVAVPMLESAAAVPCALFRLRLERVDAARVMDAQEGLAERAAHALQLTLLHSAWNLSRHSGYKARLFLGLTRPQLRRLRVMPLSKLPKLAASPGLLRCAFGASETLWRQLLTETRPELKRRLLLLVLQPRLPVGSLPGPVADRRAIH